MLTELDPRLTELVDLFWKAPPRERAAVLARMRRQRPGAPCMAEITESTTGPSRPSSPPSCQLDGLHQFPIPEADCALEGPFVRLLQRGSHPQSRAKWADMLAEYGAVLRPLPYSPKIRQIRMAVEASDMVIAFPSCCRTGHWEAALNTARTARRLFFYGESENESGLRHQLETEVIVEWNSMASKGNLQ